MSLSRPTGSVENVVVGLMICPR